MVWTPESVLPVSVKAKLAALEQKQENVNPKLFMLAFLEIVSELKHTERTGWVDRSLPKPESIADHMYRMAMICFLTENEQLNVAKCQQIALCHDMAESLVGDITPYDTSCDKTEKHRRELEAMKYIRDLVSRFNPKAGQLMYDLWCEYEYQTSPEANFVKDVDKFELISQCSEYMRAFPKVEISDIRGAGKAIKTDEVKEWAQCLDTYDSL